MKDYCSHFISAETEGIKGFHHLPGMTQLVCSQLRVKIQAVRFHPLFLLILDIDLLPPTLCHCSLLVHVPLLFSSDLTGTFSVNPAGVSILDFHSSGPCECELKSSLVPNVSVSACCLLSSLCRIF